MPATIGYHIVISGYGLWLPGDKRGHWSSEWDDMIGHLEPHTLKAGNAARERIARERMKHDPVQLNPSMIQAVIDAIGQCASASDWRIVAASVESTHTHLLVTYTPRNIDNTIKWIKDQTTKVVHNRTNHAGPVWCKGKWRSYIHDESFWNNAREYIERHNKRRGEEPRPYPFIQ